MAGGWALVATWMADSVPGMFTQAGLSSFVPGRTVL